MNPAPDPATLPEAADPPAAVADAAATGSATAAAAAAGTAAHRATAPDAAALVQRLLQAADAKAADLAAHLHPAWVAAAWRHAGATAVRYMQQVPPWRQSQLLAELYGLRWPALADLRTPAHRLALLPRPAVLRVLAVCALYPRRERIRRSIGGEVRQALVDCMGETAYRLMLDSPAPATASTRPLKAQELDPELTATTGYQALCTQGAWSCRSALALTRMCLPPGARGSVEPPSRAERASAALQRLPEFFPEHSWLFGSDMDRALSA